MTITTKTLITTKDKRGNERYYKVDAKGKKIRLTGLEYVTQIAYLMKEQNELKHAEIDAIDDYIVTTDAQQIAIDAETVKPCYKVPIEDDIQALTDSINDFIKQLAATDINDTAEILRLTKDIADLTAERQELINRLA